MPQTLFSRREIFRAAGAAGILLAPVLGARRARAALRPPCLLAVYYPNGSPGHPLDAFFPVRQGSSWDFGGRVTEPLAEYADQLTVVRDLRINRGQRPKGSHGGGNVSFLTGCDRLNHLDTDYHTPSSYSIDHHVAELTGTTTLYCAVGIDSNKANFRISWSGDDTHNEPEQSPQAAYEDLFGNWTEVCSQGQESAVAYADRKLAILDTIHADLGQVEGRFGLGASERIKIEQYEDALFGIESELQQLKEEGGCDPAAAPPELDFSDASIPARVGLFQDIIAAGMALGLRRSGVLQLFHGYNTQVYSGWLSVQSKGHHGLQHEMGTQDQADCRTITRWHCEQLRVLLSKLEAYGDPGASLLDDMVVLFGTDTPNGYTHEYTEPSPMLVFGGGGGRLVRGVDVDANGRNHVDLLATLCRAVDVDSTHFEQRLGFGGVFDQVLT